MYFFSHANPLSPDFLNVLFYITEGGVSPQWGPFLKNQADIPLDEPFIIPGPAEPLGIFRQNTIGILKFEQIMRDAPESKFSDEAVAARERGMQARCNCGRRYVTSSDVT